MKSNESRTLILSVVTVLASIVVAVSLLPVRVYAQSNFVISSETVRRSEAATISFDFMEAPASEVIKYIADHSGTNIIVSTELQDNPVTLRLINVSWRDALDLVAEQIGGIVDDSDVDILRVTSPPRFTGRFDNAPLRQVISSIARVGGANVIVAAEVDGVVTADLKDIPFLQALETIVKTSGYVLVRERNNVYRVVSLASLQDQLETRTFQLKYIQAPDSYRPIIKSGFVVGGPESGDIETERVYGVQAATAGRAGSARGAQTQFPLLNALQKILTRGLGSIEYDYFTNSLIITDIKPKLAEVERIIKLLDVEPDQVHVEVKFISTDMTDFLEEGVDWSNGLRSTISGGKTFTRLPFTLGHGGFEDDIGIIDDGPTQAHVDAVANPFTFGVLDFSQVTAILRLLKTDDNTVIKQAPKLTVLDNHEATIFVGETIRFAETFSTSSQAGGVEAGIREAENSPVETGFQLLIVPHIIEGTDTVILTIIPQTQSLSGTSETLAGFDEFTNGDLSIQLPRVASSTVVTKMLVRDGQTAVIGGLIDETESESFTKVPILGDIPLLDLLFKSKTKNKTKNNLIILIRITLVRSEEDVFKVYKANRDYYAPGGEEDLEIGRIEEERMKVEQKEEIPITFSQMPGVNSGMTEEPESIEVE